MIKGGVASYTYGMQLTIAGQIFECAGALSKVEAKKQCASVSFALNLTQAAIEYFEKQGVPFFANRTRNYTSLVFTLCQVAGWSPPSVGLALAYGVVGNRRSRI